MSRTLRYGLVIALALGGALLFLLASASANTEAFERHYPLLLAINGTVAAALAALVVFLIARLVRRYRRGRFGARLMARFAVAFGLLGVLPVVLIYLVSVQFVSRSIESWFDVRVDRALEAGLTLGRAALETQLADLNDKARTMALALADVPAGQQFAALDRLRDQAGVHEALLVGGSGQLLGTSTDARAELVPQLPGAAELRQARASRSVQAIEGDPLASDPRAGLRTRVIVPIVPAPAAADRGIAPDPGAVTSGDLRYLQLVQRVPPAVAASAQGLQEGYRDYQELSLSRAGLKKLYTLTLTLTLLLAVFAAIGFAVLLAGSMTAPLLQVAAGTRAVAEGDYRPVREFPGNDELNLLTRSFNAMTRQLTDARAAVEDKQRELEHARAYLERVLANLSAGVVVLDQEARLVTANRGAHRILGSSLETMVGQSFAQAAPELAEKVAEAFADQLLSAAPRDAWQRQMQIRRPDASQTEPLALLARGSRLPMDDGDGYVVVFDDITQMISAQRAVAWGEVARRLAHEIKNPLTPIQLTAERLQMKLADRLPPEQAAILARGASTIVNQVAAMKRMVDDFRDYARLPPSRLHPLDLNKLVEEVAALYGVESASEAGPQAPPAAQVGTSPALSASLPVPSAGIDLHLELAPDLPPIEGDATQLRQVIHNLVGNAQEALAATPGAPPRVVVRTERVTTAVGAARAVRLSVEDNGPGFAANILARAFEPYVTGKPGGTGLGLAMVKKIVDDHGARIELLNRTPTSGGGATVMIVFRRLAETGNARPAPARQAA